MAAENAAEVVMVRGGYGFRSLLKQKIKGKILLRHLHRRICFLKKNCYEVIVKQNLKKRSAIYYSWLSWDILERLFCAQLAPVSFGVQFASAGQARLNCHNLRLSHQAAG